MYAAFSLCIELIAVSPLGSWPQRGRGPNLHAGLWSAEASGHQCLPKRWCGCKWNEWNNEILSNIKAMVPVCIIQASLLQMCPCGWAIWGACASILHDVFQISALPLWPTGLGVQDYLPTPTGLGFHNNNRICTNNFVKYWESIEESIHKIIRFIYIYKYVAYVHDSHDFSQYLVRIVKSTLANLDLRFE